jgi:hypothetical protein
MITKEQIISKYEEIYSKISGNLDYSYYLNKNEEVTLTKFLSSLNNDLNLNSIDELFLHDYMCWQFSRLYERKTRLEGKIPLNHIIGQKALLEWQNRGDSWTYWRDVFIEKFNIKYKNLSTLSGLFVLRRTVYN